MLEFAAKSDVGVREGENEDAIGWDLERKIWLVADGMGGHANGQIASEIAKSSLLESDPGKGTDTQLVEAHEAIVAAAAKDDQLSGMGSTIVLAKLIDQSAEISWVGDSRAYLWRRQQLTQLTRDHSFLEVLRAQSILTEEQLRADPRGNLVTQTLGHGDPRPSVEVTPLRFGDWILLCSDGLNDELEDTQIAQILAANTNVNSAVDQLIDAALQNGGRDNTSVIIVEFQGSIGLAFMWRIMDSRWLPLAIGSMLAVILPWYCGLAISLSVWDRYVGRANNSQKNK